MREKITVWLNNARHFHHRIMARFLRKRGWVVFYLEEKYRDCNGNQGMFECWLQTYKEGEKKKMNAIQYVLDNREYNLKKAQDIVAKHLKNK